jgi:hypothetical protein
MSRFGWWWHSCGGRIRQSKHDKHSCVYLIEAHPKHGVRAKEMLATMERRRDTLWTSVFTVGEVLTGPYKRGASDLAPG